MNLELRGGQALQKQNADRPTRSTRNKKDETGLKISQTPSGPQAGKRNPNLKPNLILIVCDAINMV